MTSMAEILKKDDFKRVELLKKDYSNDKKAEKSKQKLLKQINIEIYKRNDTAIWKI